MKEFNLREKYKYFKKAFPNNNLTFEQFKRLEKEYKDIMNLKFDKKTN